MPISIFFFLKYFFLSFSSAYAIPAETRRHWVFMRTHSEQPWRVALLIIQSFLQPFLTWPTASAAQLTIFHISPILRSVSLTSSPPHTHLPSRQAQESPHTVSQAGISSMVMFPF